jgi:type IV secretion system protein VirB8
MTAENGNEIITPSRDEVTSGKYFSAARAWYSDKFLLPIAQRNLMFIAATIACLIGFFAISALLEILPVVERPSVKISVADSDNYIARNVHLVEPGLSADKTILNFFVKEYVQRREEYFWHHYDKNWKFIKAHSDPRSFGEYETNYSEQNEQSLINTLGERGEREIVISHYQINDKLTPPTATVQFESILRTAKHTVKNSWTAELAFYYDSLNVREVKDAETGKISLLTEDPVFKVVQYAVNKNE